MMYGYFTPNQIERRDLRRHGNVIGSALLVMLGAQIAASVIVILVISAISSLSFSQISALITDDIVVGYGVNTLICLLVYFIMSWIITGCTHRKISDICALTSARFPRLTAPLFLFGLGAAMAGNLLSGFLSEISSFLFGVVPYSPSIGSNSTVTLSTLLFLILNVAVFPALVEEFVYRGVIYGALEKFGSVPAIILSSVIFALVHQNFAQIPFVIVLALALGAIRAITKSLWLCIAIHLTNNLLSVLLMLVPIEYQSLANLLVIILLAVGGLVAFIWLKKVGAFKTITDSPSCFSVRKRVGLLFSSPALIVSFSLMLLIALGFFQQT